MSTVPSVDRDPLPTHGPQLDAYLRVAGALKIELPKSRTVTAKFVKQVSFYVPSLSARLTPKDGSGKQSHLRNGLDLLTNTKSPATKAESKIRKLLLHPYADAFSEFTGPGTNRMTKTQAQEILADLTGQATQGVLRAGRGSPEAHVLKRLGQIQQAVDRSLEPEAPEQWDARFTQRKAPYDHWYLDRDRYPRYVDAADGRYDEKAKAACGMAWAIEDALTLGSLPNGTPITAAMRLKLEERRDELAIEALQLAGDGLRRGWRVGYEKGEVEIRRSKPLWDTARRQYPVMSFPEGTPDVRFAPREYLKMGEDASLAQALKVETGRHGVRHLSPPTEQAYVNAIRMLEAKAVQTAGDLGAACAFSKKGEPLAITFVYDKVRLTKDELTVLVAARDAVAIENHWTPKDHQDFMTTMIASLDLSGGLVNDLKPEGIDLDERSTGRESSQDNDAVTREEGATPSPASGFEM